MENTAETPLVITPKPVTGKTKPPAPEICLCNTIVGAEDIEVYPGARGHVVIKQDDFDQGYVTVKVLPHAVPALIEMLQSAAKEIDRRCPAHE